MPSLTFQSRRLATSARVAPCMLFPESLFDGDLLHQSGDRRWWVLYTKARQEKAAARDLGSREVPHFLPLYLRVTPRNGRRHKAFVPAFSSYLFAFCDDEERVRALETNRLSRTILVNEYAQAELTRDLRSLKRAIESGELLSVESRLGPGQRVRVKSGPLIGAEGIVRERRTRSRLIVAVNCINQGVSVEIDDCFLESI